MTKEKILSDSANWCSQAAKDAKDQAVKWQFTKGQPAFSDKELSAFEAGFYQGWREAISTFNLHGYFDNK